MTYVRKGVVDCVYVNLVRCSSVLSVNGALCTVCLFFGRYGLYVVYFYVYVVFVDVLYVLFNGPKYSYLGRNTMAQRTRPYVNVLVAVIVVIHTV